MNALLRVRQSRSILGLLAGCLLCVTPMFAADYTQTPIHHREKKTAKTERPPATARIALFERDDLPRAAKLAQAEIARAPRNVDGWFLAMETAMLEGDISTEAKSAARVCRLANEDDPRALIAAMRFSSIGENSAPFREARQQIEAIAAGGSICATAALEALYEASLQGLPEADMRLLAQSAGWLTRWSIARASGTGVPEKFEFADARIQIPDYLPRNARYVAEGAFFVSQSGNYNVGGDTSASKISVDGQEVNGSIYLDAGNHTLRVEFRASETTPRLRVTLALSFDAKALANLRLPQRENEYVKAAALMASGDALAAAVEINHSDLSETLIGQQLVRTEVPAPHSQELSDHARWLAGQGRHAEAIEELTRLVREWPLDREARQVLISELQRNGNSAAADRAAAEFLKIATNARSFRRMAQSAVTEASEPFYTPYRRPAPAPLTTADGPSVILLQDKVAAARSDGSVSLYVHRVVQLMTSAGVDSFQPLALPEGAQLLSSRIVNGEIALSSGAKPGDEVEEEYVVNFTGDGGMAAHPEAFQYVFNDFDSPLLDARFVVLSPANETPGYVIASGDVPTSRIEFANGVRTQIWEKSATTATNPGIIRVVESENGWSVPPSVERRRILETIHPGPRNREA